MTDTDILIPFGGEFLALSREQFEDARSRGREIMPVPGQSAGVPQNDEILDADGMERRTGIPASWWLEQARRGEVPHLRAGKYVRFRLNEALESLRADECTRSGGPLRNGKQTARQPVTKRRHRPATTSRATGTGPCPL